MVGAGCKDKLIWVEGAVTGYWDPHSVKLLSFSEQTGMIVIEYNNIECLPAGGTDHHPGDPDLGSQALKPRGSLIKEPTFISL